MIHNPKHPGELVKEALFNGTGIKTISEAAVRLKIDRVTLSRLLNGRSGISSEMALRLELLLGPSKKMWLAMQTDYDLWLLEKRYEKKSLAIKPLASSSEKHIPRNNHSKNHHISH